MTLPPPPPPSAANRPAPPLPLAKLAKILQVWDETPAAKRRAPPPPPKRDELLSTVFPMRVPPWEKGEYLVHHEDVRTGRKSETREWWDGKRWPALAGKFSATGWQGLAKEPQK